jgi:6-phosphogluconate dehydrogenase
MGENLALNMENKGFCVSLFDASPGKVQRFVEGRGQGKNIRACISIPALIETLELPRKILLMVPAGRAVDDVLAQIVAMLAPGDIVIDGGNSHFSDTNRRVHALETKGLLFVGAGVSGGEEGALHGPSIMPGGSYAAWQRVQPIFQAIAAKVDDGVPCCDWIGDAGSGHFVKMVHNGIEYGDMQLICEVYDIMRRILRMTASEMHAVFAQWSEGPLKSYLIEITRDILAVQDDDGAPLLDKILDKAGQKGTGKWTVATALDLGVPLTLITESVFARTLSSMKDERVSAAQVLSGPALQFSGDRQALIAELGHAL